ncbi:MAG: TrkH family potassium uptake protein [Clostridiales bacterium]|jgi:trk system potassium uptake protein TrkH|nr:TrkH family potassium uptake protein [Clostridiales bacterium]
MDKKKVTASIKKFLEKTAELVRKAADKISRGNVYGKLVIFIGFLLLVPVCAAFFTADLKYAPAFLIPALFAVVSGAVVGICAKQKNDVEREWQSPLRRDSAPVLFAWLFALILGAAPFIIGGQLRPFHALFESVSGWTTTGLTLSDVENMPKVFLFYRSFMQYCGGLGFILMVNMLVQGKQEVNLFNAEGHPDRIMPNLRKTSRAIFLLYNGFLAGGVVSYVVFGMNFFEAACHAMSALSTAGFSTRADSIGAFGSLGIEIVTSVLMLAGATNFAVLLLVVKGKLKRVFAVSEIRFMLVLLASFSIFIAAYNSATDGSGAPFFRELHNAVFAVITSFSTTGFTIADYYSWQPPALFLLFILMIIGGGAGSTAGGVKLFRVHILLKAAVSGAGKRLRPSNKITRLKYNKVQGKYLIDSETVSETLGFTASYLFILFAGTLLVALFNPDADLFRSMFEFASALGTVGISNGLTAASNTPTLIVEMIGMILGRLEIFIVFVGIYSLVMKVSKTEYRIRKTSL